MLLLEGLFAPSTLRDRRQRHPAAARWQLCLSLLQQGGVIRWPAQKGQLPLLTRMLLDSAAFVRVSGGDLDLFRLGDLRGYGDAAVQRKIGSRLNDPSQFEDLMVELSIAAWHQFEGHKVTPSEADGWADLRIDIPSLDLPLLLECKRLKSATSGRLRKDITKANKQIKQVGIDAYGTALLDVSDAVPPRDSLSDETPPEVQLILETIGAALHGPKHRRIGRAIVVWDDVGILGEPPNRTAVFLRRRFTNVEHGPDPDVCILPATARTFQGSTLMLGVEWDTTGVGIEHIRCSDLMQECRKWFNFSVEELIDAFTNRNKWQPVAFADDERMFLFTRVSTNSDKQTLILAFAGRNDRALNLQFALRLPNHYVDRTDLLTPLEILEMVAADYGLELTLGDHTGRFFPRHQFALRGGGGPTPLAVVHNPEQHAVLQSMMIKVVPIEGGLVACCALAFALDRTRLLADLDT